MGARPVTTVIVAAIVLAFPACGEADDDRAGPSTTAESPTSTSSSVPAATTTTTPATTTTARAVDHSRPSAATQLTTGLLEGASPDGSALYVSAVDPALSKPGCEGQPEPLLFRVPLSGGARQALGPPGEPVRGTVLRGSERRIALVAGCEEFLTAVRVGTETSDGQLRDLRMVDVAQVRSAASVAWSGDGRQLLALVRPQAQGGQWSVVRLDPATGASAPVFAVSGPVSQVGQLADGTYVVAGGGRVTLREGNGAVRETVEGVGFSVAPDGRRLAVWGKSLSVVTPGQPAVSLASTGATDLLGPAQISPDGTALAYATSVEATASVAVVTIADRKVTTIPGRGRFVRVFFGGDGRSLAFCRLAAEPTAEPAVVVVRFAG